MRVCLRETQNLTVFNESMVHSMAEGLTVQSAEGIFTFVNPATKSLLGYEPAELIGKHWSVIVPDDQLPIVYAADERRVRGISDHYELELVRKDDARIDVIIAGSPRFDEEGHLVGTMAVFTDISKQKQFERELRESEMRYRAVSELTSEYAYAYRVEPDGELVSEWVTDGITRTTGYSSQELQSLGGWQRLIHSDDIPIALGQLDSLLSNEARTVEYRIVTKDGQVRWVRDYARPTWHSTEKRIARIEGAIQDITERKRAEEALRESEDRLSKIVRAANDGMWDWDLTTNDACFSIARYYDNGGLWCRMHFPHRLEEFQKRVHPDDLDCVDAASAAAFEWRD